MLLADHAQVADGKLYLAGGGWNFASPGRLACGVGLIFHVPIEDAGRLISFTVRLVTEHGEAVAQDGPLGEAKLAASGRFEVGTPLHAEPGDVLNMPVAFNAQVQLGPGGYAWQVEVDGDSKDEWSIAFRITDALQKHSGTEG